MLPKPRRKVQEAPAVEVIKVDNAPPTQVLTLPGDAGLVHSTIYARVSGYVAKWLSTSATESKRIRCWRRSIRRNSTPSSMPRAPSSKLPRPR